MLQGAAPVQHKLPSAISFGGTVCLSIRKHGSGGERYRLPPRKVAVMMSPFWKW